MELETHHTVICIGQVSFLDPDRLTEQPGVGFYHVDGTGVQEQIDLALLDHLHCQRTIAFVGGERARREAEAYGVSWIEGTPAVNEDLIRFWTTSEPELDFP